MDAFDNDSNPVSGAVGPLAWGDVQLQRHRSYLRLLTRLHLSAQLGKHVDASDIVQQALMEAYRGREQFRGQSEVQRLAWLRTILCNVIAATARRLKTESRDVSRERSLEMQFDLSSSRMENLLTLDQTSPSGHAVRSENLLRMASALNRLPLEQRNAIELHHLKGLTLSEVAETMGCTKSSVAGLLFRGISKLRDLMNDSESRSK